MKCRTHLRDRKLAHDDGWSAGERDFLNLTVGDKGDPVSLRREREAQCPFRSADRGGRQLIDGACVETWDAVIAEGAIDEDAPVARQRDSGGHTLIE